MATKKKKALPKASKSKPFSAFGLAKRLQKRKKRMNKKTIGKY